MIDVTVKSLAEEIRTPLDRLLKQFADAGIKKSEYDAVTQKEREKLLFYLNRMHSKIDLEKLTLQRKTRSTLNVFGIGGKNKSIQIEVRKKRVYSKSESEENLGQVKFEIKSNPVSIGKNEHKIIENEKIKNNEKKLIKKPSRFGKSLTKRSENKYPIRKDSSELFQEESFDWKRRSKESNKGYYRSVILKSVSKPKVVEYEKDRVLEDVRRTRGRIKNIRFKKSNRYSEVKIDREEECSIIPGNKRISKNRKQNILKKIHEPAPIINRNVVIGETISVAELANKMAVKGSKVISIMMKMGIMVTINQVINQDTARLVAEKMGNKVILKRENELEEEVMSDRDIGKVSEAESRASVVTVMGHVDHGKTSLLDYIRSTKVASKEAGGITQRIGAYHVKTKNGVITFLDTPGHAAFTAMRTRGVQATDIVVLVVAADDGVMPQTIEAIQQAKAANVPVVVAINKIDKIEVDFDRLKNGLSKYGIISEEWGGENIFVNVSARFGTGIDDLLEAILLQAEMLELRAIRKGMAKGVVIESFLDKGRGPVATVLVREGTLSKGDSVLCGFEYGRVRAMHNELGDEVLEAGPSIPVEILGLSGVPAAGDIVTVVRDEKKAREVALYRHSKFRSIKLAHQQKLKLENMFVNMAEEKNTGLNIILKADTKGSLEAIIDSLIKLSNDEVKVKIIGAGVGGITETDTSLAISSKKVIVIGFNVRVDSSARRIIESESIDVRYYSVIYNLIDDIKFSINRLLSEKNEKKVIGFVEVRSIFKSKKFGIILGCIVIEGIVKRNSSVRVLRGGLMIHEGKIESLRRFKEDVNEVSNGMECGIGIKNYNDIKVGDTIEIFEVLEIKRNVS